MLDYGVCIQDQVDIFGGSLRRRLHMYEKGKLLSGTYWKRVNILCSTCKNG